MGFTPRLTPPKKNNKYYSTQSAGGYSTCILGNYPYGAAKSKRTGLPGLNVLNNCVGYVCGRYSEIGDYKKIKYNLNTDAKNFIALAKQLGLKTGKTPKLGCIMVWKGGSGNSQYGHVAICEQIISSTEIVVSQSGWSYKGTDGMWTANHKKGDGNWIQGADYSWMANRYTFLGCIYHPDVTDETTTSTSSDLLAIDGSFGPLTIKAIQRRLSLKETGTLDATTIKHLQNFLMVPITKCDGTMSVLTVKKLQSWLQRKGYYSETINGKLDSNTVKAWQTYLNAYFRK